MARRWLTLMCVAVLIGACGGSSEAPSTTTPVVHSPDLRLLPPVPEPSATPPSSLGTSRSAFLRAVFDDAQAMWTDEFQSAGLTYRPARLTIFSRQVHTACGPGEAGTGPFYCPASFGVYLDPTFFALLSRNVGVRLGDVAQAYVVAHEVGHHIQTLLGLTHRKAVADQQDPAGASARSVRFELQADCLAGVWMHSVYRRGQLTDADLADALNAAAVAGDDFMRNAAGQTRPHEDWTHGSSAERQRAFQTGFSSGDMNACGMR